MKTLGLLLTSDRYPHYAIHMARAANAKGLTVHIHLTGTAARLFLDQDFIDLQEIVKFSVSTEDNADLRVIDLIKKRETPFTVGLEQVVGFIEDCDRYVVL